MSTPRETAARRRRLAVAALAVLAIVAAAVGLAVGSGGGDSESASPSELEPGSRTTFQGGEEGAAPGDRNDGGSGGADGGAKADAERLPLPKAVGQTLVFAFDGTEAPEYVHRRMRRGEGAGVILFGGNVADARQLRRLTRGIQRAARGGALIATDQEGGDIRNVEFAGPAAPQSATATVAAARAAATEAARALRDHGVNVNLAPVVDVQPAVGGGALPGRLYPGGPEEVAALGAASVRAHDRLGVGTTVKHYPGLGRATVNTDFGSSTVDASRAAIEKADLEPYRAAIAAGAPIVMSGHALYPAFDPERIASQSRVLMTDVLRDRLGFDGVAMTDSIEAKAVLDRSGVATAAVRSIAAGNDIVLMTGSGSWNLVYPRLLRKARRDPEFRARVHEAASRVAELKRRLGLRAES